MTKAKRTVVEGEKDDRPDGEEESEDSEEEVDYDEEDSSDVDAEEDTEEKGTLMVVIKDSRSKAIRAHALKNKGTKNTYAA